MNADGYTLQVTWLCPLEVGGPGVGRNGFAHNAIDGTDGLR